jgi:hypothetical protein
MTSSRLTFESNAVKSPSFILFSPLLDLEAL